MQLVQLLKNNWGDYVDNLNVKFHSGDTFTHNGITYTVVGTIVGKYANTDNKYILHYEDEYRSNCVTEWITEVDLSKWNQVSAQAPTDISDPDEYALFRKKWKEMFDSSPAIYKTPMFEDSKSCDHDLKQYIGFSESYKFCSKCNYKENL